MHMYVKYLYKSRHNMVKIRNTEDIGKIIISLENRRNQVHIQCLGPPNTTIVLKM